MRKGSSHLQAVRCQAGGNHSQKNRSFVSVSGPEAAGLFLRFALRFEAAAPLALQIRIDQNKF
ncbi:hypothetical protein B0E45_27740 [Sinorhizobium sp. A49]|nr:hypothetical protein B0E45_27740 [Sinorhizobium sp. A49]